MSDSFNLSRWAIQHGSFTRFLILVLTVGGILAYLELGQREDSDFTFRVMVVQTLWPGAPAHEVEQLVTDKIEEKLVGTPWLFHAKLLEACESMVFMTLSGAPPPAVRGIWHHVRNKVGTSVIACRRESGLLFQRRVRRHLHRDVRLSRRGVQRRATAPTSRSHAKDSAWRAGVEKVDLFGEQDPRVHVEFSQRKLAELGIGLGALAATLSGQNAVAPARRCCPD